MNEAKLQQVGENLIPAIAYGDSLGLPVETKSRQQIAEIYGGKIDRLHSISNPFFGEAVAGTWSDGTQLSLAVAEALIESGSFDMEAIAHHHVRALEQTPTREFQGKPVPRGWGKSSWESVMKIKNGEADHRNSGNPDGQGNGVLMKLAPLALWQAITKPSDVLAQVADVARMTHNNDLSVVTALVHRDMLNLLLNGEVDAGNLLEAAQEKARSYESKSMLPNAGDATSSLLQQLDRYPVVKPEIILEVAPGGGFFSPETLVMAYGAYRINSHYPGSVHEAVNLGGDTDSIGSIVAAMSIMDQPNVEHPEDLQWIVDLGRLRKTSRELVRVAMEGVAS